MKKCFKVLSLGLCCLLGAGLGLGCNRGGGDPNTIQIYMWKSGVGTDWMSKIVDDFNASQDEYTAVLDTSSSAATIISTLSAGSGNEYDLYFTMLNTAQYNSDFLDLTDVLEGNATGENVTIESKYYEGLLSGLYNADGTVSTLSYGNGWTGILYNTDLVAENKVPNTTKELERLVAELGQNAWIFYNDQYNNGYWNYVTNVWQAQYEGLDYYNNTMLKLKDAEGKSPSKEVFTGASRGGKEKDGRYKAFQAMQSFVSANSTHPEVTNTNFTTVQNLFLSGKAALTVNGNWLMNEMKQVKSNIAMMRIPVLSSIVEVLEDKQMSDATLSSIIDDIDEGTEWSESYAACSKNDFERIKEARNLMSNTGTEQYVFIPEYSNCIEGSKEFLRYFYSDAGTLAYMNSLKMPASVRLTDESKFDKTGLSSWHLANFTFTDTLTPLVTRADRADLFRNFGINQIANVVTAQALAARNIKDYKDADKLWDAMMTTINDRWEEWTE